MTKAEMAEVMDRTFLECQKFREAGQKEYAHRDENAFANFERVAERLGVDRKQVLLVYFEKHIDAIHSHVQGHTSQREHVNGRINDAIVYLCLLRGMIEEETDSPSAGTKTDYPPYNPNWKYVDRKYEHSGTTIGVDYPNQVVVFVDSDDPRLKEQHLREIDKRIGLRIPRDEIER